MRAGRRRYIVANPPIQRDKERSLGEVIFVPVGSLRTSALGRQVAARNVLRTGKQINPDVLRDLGVVAPVKRRVYEGRRAPPAPVFNRRVGVEDFWTLFRCKLCLDPIYLSGYRSV